MKIFVFIFSLLLAGGSMAAADFSSLTVSIDLSTVIVGVVSCYCAYAGICILFYGCRAILAAVTGDPRFMSEHPDEYEDVD